MTDEIHNYMGIGVVVTLVAAFLMTTSTSFAMTKPLLDNQINKFSASMSTYHYEDVYTNSNVSLSNTTHGLTQEQCIKVLMNNNEVIKSVHIVSWLLFTDNTRIKGTWDTTRLNIGTKFIKDQVPNISKVGWFCEMLASDGSPFFPMDSPPTVDGSVDTIIKSWTGMDYGNGRFSLEYLTDYMGRIHVLIREEYWSGRAQYSPSGKNFYTANDRIDYFIKTARKIPYDLSRESSMEYCEINGRPNLITGK